MAKRPTKQATRVSDEATVRATGRTGAEWHALLDAENAQLWSHKERVGFLRRHGVEQSWWQQAVSVNYERARGIRLLGETGSAGFEFGIARTFGMPAERAWERLVAGPGLAAWAGEGAAFAIEKGASQQLPGRRIEVRGVTPGVRVRLAVTSADAPKRTIQMSVVPNAEGRASVRFHEEGLPGIAARKRAERRWNKVMEDVAELLSAR